MKLYLHIGTEKTGSSFMQTYLATNRELLQKHGICYPHGGDQEAKMKDGRISKGNAAELEKYLYIKDFKKLKLWIIDKKKEAEKKKCEKILLSNEVLILRFSIEGVLKDFLKILNDLNITCEKILLIIREPINQALSLYEHRSKVGTLYPIKEWLEHKYFIADALKSFYRQINSIELSFTQYPYRKDSRYLIEVFLNKWLELRENIEVQHIIINPSLTLSELILLCEIYKKDKLLANCFYDYMIKIDAKNKSDDNFNKAYIKNHINNYMVKCNKLWDEVSKHMTIETETWKYTSVEIAEDNKITSFSDQQIQQISDFIVYAKSFKYYRYKINKKIRKALVKITPKSLLELRKKVLYS